MTLNTIRRLLNLSTIINTGASHIFRRFSTAQKPPTNCREFNKHNLYNKLSYVWSTNQTISDVLDQFSRNGSKRIAKYDLIHCIKKLRSFGRYQHCLEVLEWMKKAKKGYSEHALHLNIICKVKGIEEAEKYFDSLPGAKSGSTYGALLNCYCTAKMTEKALTLFRKMDEMKCANNDMAFSNLMCLHLKDNQPEKVPPLVEEMKRRNIPISTVSYISWMHSYACNNDLEGVERVMNEVQKQNIRNDWKFYCSYASAYIKAGQHETAARSLERVEEILDNTNYPDRIGYHHLISLYASIGDLGSVTRAWVKLKSKFKDCTNMSYLRMLHALSKLGNIEHLKMCFEEWNSRYSSYDVRLPTVVIGAYLRREMVEEAELLLKEITDRTGQKIQTAHALLMDYYLEKCMIDSASRHLDLALANEWKPPAEKFDDTF